MCCSCTNLLLVFLSLLVISNLGVGLAHITVGTRNLENCPAESLLPVAVIVNGALAALLAVWGVWDAVRANSKWTGVPGEAERLMGPSAPDDACVRGMEALRWLLNTVAISWASLTLFLVLRTRSTYGGNASQCDTNLIQTSVILASIAVANAALVALVNVVLYLAR